MIRAIIIDDEQKARIRLASHLKKYCPEVTILDLADNIEKGVNAINKHNPNVVFLDTVYSNGSGFNLLKQLKEINFKIVFVTSFNQYAIKSFKYNAFDYLLKPLDIGELCATVKRLKSVV